ncbi:MAG: preprotein translocase subunit SecB [Methylohalobius sp. ZOD2]
MSEDLQKAIECLTIRDVYMRASSAALADDFEPKYEHDLNKLAVQFKHVVTHSNVLELEEDGDNTSKLFRVFVDLGTRWVLPDAESDDALEIKAHIEAIMVAEYQLESDPGPEALKAFALKNASFHIWPYWREYLSSQCLRMNLPKLVMPTRQFASNHNAE